MEAESERVNGNYESDDRKDEEEDPNKPMPKQLTTLFGHAITSGATKAIGAVEAGASYVVSPLSPGNIWPDMDNVDNLINVLTIAGYTFTAFSLVGSAYLLSKTAREAVQWRTWLKYRRKINRPIQRTTQQK